MHSGTGLACALLDAEGHLADAVAAMRREVDERFDHLAFRIDSRTHPRTIEAAMRLGARVRVSPRELDSVGRERRGAVADARAAGAGAVVTGDLDHILRWVRAAPGELDAAVARVHAGEVDCLVVGRPAGAFERAPAPLRETERLVNLAFERLTGHGWDLLSSVRVLSSAAADVIVEDGEVDTLGSDVEWPLLCDRAGGLVVEYLEAPHLSYEEGNLLDAEPADPAAPGTPAAWLGRLRICGWMADAMAPYLPGADAGAPPA
jgi:hypothetical protein